MDTQEKITPEQVKESIAKSYEENVKPFFQYMEKRTRRVGRNGKIIDLREEKK